MDRKEALRQLLAAAQATAPDNGERSTPMENFRGVVNLTPALPSALYKGLEDDRKAGDGGIVKNDLITVSRAGIPVALEILEVTDESQELYVDLVISSLPPEERGYKKVDEGASALEALKAKLKG